MTPSSPPSSPFTEGVSVVERVARAIETYGVAYSHVTLADMSTVARRWRVHKIIDRAPTEEDAVETFDEKGPAYALCRRLNARAAIEAIREPDKAMIEAGELMSPMYDDLVPHCTDYWDTMISAALKEGEGRAPPTSSKCFT